MIKRLYSHIDVKYRYALSNKIIQKKDIIIEISERLPLKK